MKNQIYRLDCSGTNLEFFVVDTNEVNPMRKTKEVGIIVYDKNKQLDFDLDEEAVKSLIKYLNESLEYITEFNKNSKPTE